MYPSKSVINGELHRLSHYVYSRLLCGGSSCDGWFIDAHSSTNIPRCYLLIDANGTRVLYIRRLLPALRHRGAVEKRFMLSRPSTSLPLDVFCVFSSARLHAVHEPVRLKLLLSPVNERPRLLANSKHYDEETGVEALVHPWTGATPLGEGVMAWWHGSKHNTDPRYKYITICSNAVM